MTTLPKTTREFVELVIGRPLTYVEQAICDSMDRLSSSPPATPQAAAPSRVRGATGRIIIDDPYDPERADGSAEAKRTWWEEQAWQGRIVTHPGGTSGSIYGRDGNRVGGWFQTRVPAEDPIAGKLRRDRESLFDTMAIMKQLSRQSRQPTRIVPLAMTDVVRRGGKGTP